mmetsp:Transcript_11895/g.21019  ORF Transcript_11895/g.21019 Transcript_11895/m.21019 type:complete len:240 (-) Transcript_11895:366-1085(-)
MVSSDRQRVSPGSRASVLGAKLSNMTTCKMCGEFIRSLNGSLSPISTSGGRNTSFKNVVPSTAPIHGPSVSSSGRDTTPGLHEDEPCWTSESASAAPPTRLIWPGAPGGRIPASTIGASAASSSTLTAPNDTWVLPNPLRSGATSWMAICSIVAIATSSAAALTTAKTSMPTSVAPGSYTPSSSSSQSAGAVGGGGGLPASISALTSDAVRATSIVPSEVSLSWACRSWYWRISSTMPF